MTEGRAYISGPDDAGQRIENAERAAQERGFEPVNPQKITQSISHWEHSEIMEVRKALMRGCEAAFFMAGWKSSHTCQLEYSFAKSRNMAIILWDKRGGARNERAYL